MTDALQKDIGAIIDVQAGTPPLADTGTTVNGAAIDRTGRLSCVLALQSGAATGTPTAQTADAKLQDSADGTTGWADITGAAVTQLTADNTEAEVNVNLMGAKKFVRVVRTVALTAGTSPTWPVATPVVFGGGDENPI